MKFSRRGILAGLFATGAAPSAAVETPAETLKPGFVKGMVMPRPVMTAPQSPYYPWAGAGMSPVIVIEYDIYDGKKFVALNSDAGQRVVAELGDA